MKLHLHVKSEYFAQIKAGTKREFAGIVIYNAYKPGADNRIEFPWRGWRLTGITHPHFGPDDVTVFAIKLEGAA